MTWLKRLFLHTNSFFGQQQLVIMLVCTVILALSQGSSLVFEYISFNRDSRDRLAALADIIAADISAALLFGDNKAIEQNLQSLKADPTLIQLFVLNDAGALVASYLRAGRPRMLSDLELQRKLIRQKDDKTVFQLSPKVSRPIIHDGVQLGTIILELDSSIFLKKLRSSFGIGAAILLLSLFGSYLLARRLGQIIIDPLLSLAETMEKVSRTKDYQLRAEISGVKELSLLAEGFNEMLVEIADRDEVLLERQARLHRQAHYDTLTGLPNRTLFNDRLTQSLLSAERKKETMSVLFIDLDDFKLINDTHGHRVGDLLLIEVSQRLDKETRASDSLARDGYSTLARMGGDEFTIYLQDVKSADNALQVARRLLNSLLSPYLLEDKQLFISASIGIALYPDHGSNAEMLVRSSDAAMYLAKQKGKNHIETFTQSLHSKASERLALHGDLRRALENKEFILHYQPRINLQTGNLCSVEALIRWMHPDRGLIPPLTFIPLAEETGLIMEIGEWVLLEACRQMQRWHRAGIHVPRISVNVSPLQFRRQNIVELATSVLSETCLNSQALELEITESALMDDISQAIITLQQLQQMGVRISIDDFGTGYSSLSHLRSLPVNTLKVDRSFVMNAHVSEEDAQILSAILAMAHSLNLGTVVEGVECQEQHDLLRKLECGEVQGYYYARPMPAAGLEAMVLEKPLVVGGNFQSTGTGLNSSVLKFTKRVAHK